MHRVENTPNIEVLFDVEMKDVLGEHAVNSRANAIHGATGEERKLDVTGLFIAIGPYPGHRDLRGADGALDPDDRGYLKHDADRTNKNARSCSVAGDCADKVYRD
ncbi:MAG: hypothetical protein IPJ85_18090 [Flavobacteriales bacterium]|nr:hypothetical protein [Flavobacteriales bacterium]